MRQGPAGPDVAADDEPGTGVLIVGYGSPLRSDDGVGPIVAERLAGDPRLRGAEIRAEHQLTPELALDASRVTLLVLVDAADGVSAGEVVVRELAPLSAGPRAQNGSPDGSEEGGAPLTHHVDPAALLGLARELWGAAPRTVLVGVGPASLELGDALSAQVEAAVPLAVEAVVAAVTGQAIASQVGAGEG